MPTWQQDTNEVKSLLEQAQAGKTAAESNVVGRFERGLDGMQKGLLLNKRAKA
jgi:hypothetical protein